MPAMETHAPIDATDTVSCVDQAGLYGKNTAGVNYRSGQKETPFPFLALPAETRSQIYRLLLSAMYTKYIRADHTERHRQPDEVWL